VLSDIIKSERALSRRHRLPLTAPTVSLIDALAARFSSNAVEIPFGRSETQTIGAPFQGCANSGRFKFKKFTDNQGRSSDKRELSRRSAAQKSRRSPVFTPI
jgi:hypothetical protein